MVCCHFAGAISRLLQFGGPAMAIAIDNLKRLPLHWAAAGGHSEAVAALVNAVLALKIDLHIPDANGASACQLAANNQHVDVVTVLLEASHNAAAAAVAAATATATATTGTATPAAATAAAAGTATAGAAAGGTPAAAAPATAVASAAAHKGLTALHMASQNKLEPVSRND